MGLKANNGCFKAFIALSSHAIDNIKWWIANAGFSGKAIGLRNHDLVMYSDASLKGYGCYLNGQRTGSMWTNDEILEYGDNINALEMLAVFLSLKSFMNVLQSKTF